MADFPTALNELTDDVGTATTPLATGHVAVHNELATIGEALMAKVGVDSSAVVTSHDYLIAQYKPRFIALTGDISDSSGNAFPVTGMTFTTVAGATYLYEVNAIVQTNATSVGILLTLNHSTAVTSINAITEYPTSATAWSTERITALLGGTLPSTGPGTTNTRYTIVGSVVINTAGNLTLSMKSETATATTVVAGSHMRVWRTA